MRNRLIGFKAQYREALLDFLWKQWSFLGIAGHAGESDFRMIDPEALLCITCIIGRHEPRMFDEAVDWLRENGGLIHLSRLKALSALPGLECKRTLGAIALHLENKAGTQKWKALKLEPVGSEPVIPFFETAGMMTATMKTDAHFQSQGYARGEFRFSGKSGRAQGNGGSNLLIRLRSLFGVNARADILAFLLARESGHPHAIARQTHYFVKTVQDALVQMRDSGLVHARSEAGKKVYSLDHSAWKPLLFPDSEAPRFTDWPAVFSQFAALDGILKEIVAGDASDLLMSAKLKSWARMAAPEFAAAAIGMTLRDEAGFPGEAYIRVFIEDMERLFAFLK